MERTQSFLLLSLWLHCHVTTRTGTPQPLLSEHLCVRLRAQSYAGALCGSVLLVITPLCDPAPGGEWDKPPTFNQ